MELFPAPSEEYMQHRKYFVPDLLQIFLFVHIYTPEDLPLLSPYSLFSGLLPAFPELFLYQER